MGQEEDSEPLGAISPSEYRAQIVRNINEATINLRSSFAIPPPESVPVRSSDLIKLIENSKKAVKMLKEQEKKDVRFLVIGTLAGLILGIIGNLLVSVFIEIYRLYVPVESNLKIWAIDLVAVIVGTVLVGWYLYKKMARTRQRMV